MIHHLTLKEATTKFLQQRVMFKCNGTGITLVGICRNVILKDGQVTLIVRDIPCRATQTFQINANDKQVKVC